MMKTLLFLVIAGVAISGALRAEEVAQQSDGLAELSKETRAKLDDLTRRVREQNAKGWSSRGSAKRIDVKAELAEFCSTHDLVVIIGSERHELRTVASALLQTSLNKKLTAEDIDRLCEYLKVQDPKKTWQGKWAGRILAKNKPLGIPALANILKNTTNRFARMHAAGSLAGRDVKVDAQLKRRAQQASPSPWISARRPRKPDAPTHAKTRRMRISRPGHSGRSRGASQASSSPPHPCPGPPSSLGSSTQGVEARPPYAPPYSNSPSSSSSAPPG